MATNIDNKRQPSSHLFRPGFRWLCPGAARGGWLCCPRDPTQTTQQKPLQSAWQKTLGK